MQWPSEFGLLIALCAFYLLSGLDAIFCGGAALLEAERFVAGFNLNSAVEPISAEKIPLSIRSDKRCADQRAMYSEATDPAV